jgi:hypothetical protein
LWGLGESGPMRLRWARLTGREMPFQLPLQYTAAQSDLGGLKRKVEIVRLKAAQAPVCRKSAMGWKLGVV